MMLQMMYFFSNTHVSWPISDGAMCLSWPDLILHVVVGDTAFKYLHLYLGHLHILRFAHKVLSWEYISKEMGDLLP